MPNAECRWWSRGVAQRPRNLEKIVRIAPEDCHARRLGTQEVQLGKRQGKRTTSARKKQKNSFEWTKTVVKTVNL